LNVLAVSCWEVGIRLLTICGSLRSKSSNAALLEAVALVASDAVEVSCYDGLASLPQFNPDIDIDPAPVAVRALREQIAAADAVIISSPEYAHGVPGALKNALDWLVSGVEIYGKPVVLLNPSPRSLFAHPQLAETLRTMGALIAQEASVSLPIAGRGLDAAAIAGDPELAESLRGVLVALTSV
jgi:NAD(P)H-dependent FMN reductase